MNATAIILGLCLSCGIKQDVPPSDVTSPQSVLSFCKVMQNPKQFQDKPMVLQATAYILYGGILLNSDECKAPDVTLHYKKDYEKGSNAEALEQFKRLRREVHEAHLRGAGIEAERIIVSAVFEGSVQKNPNYRMKIDRGVATLAAWDYNEEYAFVVERVVSLRRL